MTEYGGLFYSDQTKALAIAPKAPAVLSIAGSSYVIYDLVQGRRKKLKRSSLSNWILLLMSICDIVWSFFHFFLTTWMVPKGQAWGSAGTNFTCTLQALLGGVFGNCVICYNAALAICYVMMVRYDWKEAKLIKYRYLFLLPPIAYNLAFFLPHLADNSFNYQGSMQCWIATYPLLCETEGAPFGQCERGEHIAASGVTLKMDTALKFTVSIVLFLSMISLYLFVRGKESAQSRFQFDGSVDRTMSRKVAMQGICFISSFLISWILFFVYMCISFTGEMVPFKLTVALVTLLPLQGFFNALVYLRPRYFEYIRRNPESSISNKVTSLFRWSVSRTSKNLSSNDQTTTADPSDQNTEDNGLDNTAKGSDLDQTAKQSA